MKLFSFGHNVDVDVNPFNNHNLSHKWLVSIGWWRVCFQRMFRYSGDREWRYGYGYYTVKFGLSKHHKPFGRHHEYYDGPLKDCLIREDYWQGDWCEACYQGG